MSYLVTGVAGFIGSNLAHKLLEDGYTVVGLDNIQTGQRRNVESLEEHENFSFIEGDLRDESTVDAAMTDTNYILHQGAVPSVPRSVANPVLSTDVNCTGTATLLSAARNNPVEKIVVASSSSVYGPKDITPKHEKLPPNPASPYALSKYYTEQLAIQASELYEFDTVALRYFNIFGPRQDPDSEYAAVIPKFISRMREGKRPVIYGDGTQTRDFTYIDNAVQANLQALKSEVSGEVFNVGCGESHSINTLTSELNERLGTNLDPIYDDSRPGDVPHSTADISKASERIEYECQVSFRDGLQRTVRWFNNRD